MPPALPAAAPRNILHLVYRFPHHKQVAALKVNIRTNYKCQKGLLLRHPLWHLTYGSSIAMEAESNLHTTHAVHFDGMNKVP